ncbi:DoxX family protein [Actinokineospora sp. NPDC004072]
MFTAYVVVTLVTAAANVAAAVADFVRAEWIVANLSRYGLPRSWLAPLGIAKAAGAAGLLTGFAVPALGIAAAVGLVLYFAGAVVAVARARWYSHLLYPGLFLATAAAALWLGLAAR